MNSSNRDAMRVASVTFTLLAMLFSLVALVTSVKSASRADKANNRISALAAEGVVPRLAKITLEEFSINAHPAVVKAGTVTLEVSNVGTITHEMVLIRAASASALPRVTKAGGERAIGAVDEEAIPAADKMGETGDVRPRSTVTKTFSLTPGTYVMFCNIDTKQGATVLNHFVHGMVETIVAV